MIIPFKCNKVRLTSAYGNRVLNGKKEFHGGYDMVGVGSSEVVAAIPGKVIRSRIVTDKTNPTWQWGNYVCISGTDGLDYYYCHLASRTVQEGQTVKAGDCIGIMGNTGYSFGAHLHFEVRQNGKAIDPSPILGLANKVGTYEMPDQFSEDINVLVKRGVIASPSYWLQRRNIDPYFPRLIHNMAERLM